MLAPPSPFFLDVAAPPPHHQPRRFKFNPKTCTLIGGGGHRCLLCEKDFRTAQALGSHVTTDRTHSARISGLKVVGAQCYSTPDGRIFCVACQTRFPAQRVGEHLSDLDHMARCAGWVVDLTTDDDAADQGAKKRRRKPLAATGDDGPHQMNIVPLLTLMKPEQSRYDFYLQAPYHEGDLRADLDGQPAVVTSMRKGLYQVVADVPRPEYPAATFKKTLVIWDAAMAPIFIIELSFECDAVIHNDLRMEALGTLSVEAHHHMDQLLAEMARQQQTPQPQPQPQHNSPQQPLYLPCYHLPQQPHQYDATTLLGERLLNGEEWPSAFRWAFEE